MNSRITLFKDVLNCCETDLPKSPCAFLLEATIYNIQYLLAVEEGTTNDLSLLNKLDFGWFAARELDGYPNTTLVDKLFLVAVEVEKMRHEKNNNG